MGIGTRWARSAGGGRVVGRESGQRRQAGAQTGGLTEQTVLALVQKQVERWPRSVAFSGRMQASLTYQRLWDLAGSLAYELVARGIRPGDLVAVAIDPSADMVVAFLGILRAGATYLSLDNRAPAERLALILGEAAPAVVVYSEHGTAGTADPLWKSRLPVDLPGLTVPRQPSSQVQNVQVAPDDPAYVAYTSGSTGRPKGVVVPHRAIVRLVTEAAYCPIGADDRVANLSNPAFDATTFEVWAALAVGAAVVETPTPVHLPIDEWTAAIRNLSITTMFVTTSLFHSIVRERPSAFKSLKHLVVGGEQLDADMVRRVLDADPPDRIVNGYGPTETTTFAAAFECGREAMRGVSRTPIGFPLQNTTLHVLDEQLRPVPPGQAGELCIGGPGVALGYLARPELTAERFVTASELDERVYRTGDLARQLPTGALEILGRTDRQVKLRGFRIELEEIERTVSATGLVDAVFVEKVGAGPAAVLIGFVLPTAGDGGDLPTVLRERLARLLPDYMIPARWMVLSKVPLGPTGKVDRHRLLTLLEPVISIESDGIVDDVCRIWQEVLQIPRVCPQDNFLDLGGNSLLAVQVASRLSPELSGRVEPSDILLAESAADLCARLRPVRTV